MLKKISYITLFFLLFCSSKICLSQNFLTGRIIDETTKEGLAFVNIIYNSINLGTTTDIDGYFKIERKDKIEFLKISYLGYESKTIELKDLREKQYIEIKLKPIAITLQEVVILPGENPAHRIINLVIENANKNNPEKVRSFSYVSYNKMYFTVDFSQIKLDTTAKNDTALKQISDFFDEQYIFLTESVTERKFLYPDNNKENVIAHRMSGIKNPSFALLLSQFQSFSFYSDFVNILDKKYLSPISKNSTKRYLFLIEDTIYSENNDTVFVISFRPRKETNFDGLQGVLHINSNGYAIQSVIAKPFEPIGSFNVNIQQKYEFIDNKQWFPVQLNTDLIFNLFNVSGDTLTISNNSSIKNNDANLPIIGIGKTYIYDINLNPDYKRKDFNQLNVIIEDDAHKKPEDFWNQYRNEKLNEKEIKTYEVVDSIGEEINLDKIMEITDFFLSGYIPFSIFNIDLASILWYNQYEKYRLGLGVSTNNKLSKYFSVGGYFAYGFGDKAWKYGCFTDFFFNKASTTRLRLAFKRDLIYSDDLIFNKNLTGFAQQNLRDFFLTEMDSVQSHMISFKFKSFKYLDSDIRINYTKKNIINLSRYAFLNYIPQNINTIEKAIYLRYAYKEKFIQTPKGNRLSLGTNYPILYFNFIHGTDLSNHNKTYFKTESMLTKKFTWRAVGETNITFIAAFANNNTPYSNLYYGIGSYSWLNIYNSFNTMRINEFISDRFISVFILHDFGSLLFKTKKWQPKIELFSAAGWGNNNLIDMNSTSDMAIKMNKGYFESGLILNNLIKINFQGFGLAVFYRYGPYSLNKEFDNWTFKISYSYVF